MPAAVARAKSAKTKLMNGRQVSARNRSGDPACSQAMSDWVTTRKSGSTPASVFAILGQCRAKARALKQASQHKAAGNEAKAQRLEAIASGKKGPVTAKDRMSLAKEKRATLNAKRASNPITAAMQGGGASASSPASPQPSQAKAAGRGTPERMELARSIKAVRDLVPREMRSQYGVGRGATSIHPTNALRGMHQSESMTVAGEKHLLMGLKTPTGKTRAKYASRTASAEASVAAGQNRLRKIEDVLSRRGVTFNPAHPSVFDPPRTKRQLEDARTAKAEMRTNAAYRRLNDSKPGERHFGPPLPGQKQMTRLEVAQQLRADRAAKRTSAQPAEPRFAAMAYNNNTDVIRDNDHNFYATVRTVKGKLGTSYEVKGYSKFEGKHPDIEKNVKTTGQGRVTLGRYSTKEEAHAAAMKIAELESPRPAQPATPPTPSLRPAAELTDSNKAAIKSTLKAPAELLQKMRQARYMATIDAGQNKGKASRETLQRERERLGITPDAVRKAREKQALIAKQAASKGFDPNQAVAYGRKANMQEVRDRFANGGTMLSRGAGYYPSPSERVAKRAAVMGENKAAATKFREQLDATEAAKIQANTPPPFTDKDYRVMLARRIKEARKGILPRAPEGARVGKPIRPTDLMPGDQVYAKDKHYGAIPIGGLVKSKGGNAKDREFATGAFIARGATAHPVRDIPAYEKTKRQPPQPAPTPSLRAQADAFRAGKGGTPALRKALATEAKILRGHTISPRDASPMIRDTFKKHLEANTPILSSYKPAKADIKRAASRINESTKASMAEKAKMIADKQQKELAKKSQEQVLAQKAEKARANAEYLAGEPARRAESARRQLSYHRASGPKMRAKDIEALPYGSHEQVSAANRYVKRLDRLESRHEGDSIGYAAREARRKLGRSDVFALALRRRNDQIADNRYAPRGTQDRLIAARKLRELRLTARS